MSDANQPTDIELIKTLVRAALPSIAADAMASDLFTVAYARLSKGQFVQSIPLLEALCERSSSSSVANMLASIGFLGVRRYDLARRHAVTARMLSDLLDHAIPPERIDEYVLGIAEVEAWRPPEPEPVEDPVEVAPFPPQIEDLNNIHMCWMPYINWMMRPNQYTASISTDGYGCRHTIGRSGEMISVDDFAGPEYFAFFGGSAAFGAGATGNDKTIPSRLSAMGDGTPWLNFAIPASIIEFNLISALFLRPMRARPRAFVIFGGCNELYAPLVQPLAIHPFGCGWHIPDILVRSMGPIEEWALSMGAALVDATPAAERNIEDICNRLEILFTKTLRNFSYLTQGCGAPLYFVLQPNTYWMRRRKFHPQELEYLSVSVARSDGYKVAGDLFAELLPWYRDMLIRVCGQLGIGFIDANDVIDDPRYESECIFIDPVHLTDDGYAAMSRIIYEEILA